MDLETRVNLRSFIKVDSTPILKAVVIALFFHILFVIYWSSNESPTVAEIPEWVNVKLVAGFENSEKIVVEKKHTSTKKNINKLKPLPVKKEKITEEQQKKSKTSATTFIAADSRPYKLENSKPVYPSAARRRGMQGIVLLSVNVNKEGYVEKINVLRSSGFKVLDRSALKSVKGWRFIPAKRAGHSIASVMEIPVRFILNDV